MKIQLEFIRCIEDAEHLNTVRLHLWDLSMLTKPIEHEGNLIKVIDLMSNNFRMNYEMLSMQNINDMKVFDYDILLRYHFNIFGLDDLQYINKATLKTQ